MLKKHERVLMKNCVGARRKPNKIWECITDEYENQYKEKVVKLKDCDTEEFPVKMLEKYREVYKLNDYEWYVTSWSLEDTVNWYNSQFSDNIDINEVASISINKDTEGLWIETKEECDKERLGNSDEITSTIINKDGKRVQSTGIGDLISFTEGEILKYTSFNDVIKEHYTENPLKEPELIATLDY